jgi:hypothetical protein
MGSTAVRTRRANPADLVGCADQASGHLGTPGTWRTRLRRPGLPTMGTAAIRTHPADPADRGPGAPANRADWATRRLGGLGDQAAGRWAAGRTGRPGGWALGGWAAGRQPGTADYGGRQLSGLAGRAWRAWRLSGLSGCRRPSTGGWPLAGWRAGRWRAGGLAGWPLAGWRLAAGGLAAGRWRVGRWPLAVKAEPGERNPGCAAGVPAAQSWNPSQSRLIDPLSPGS